MEVSKITLNFATKSDNTKYNTKNITKMAQTNNTIVDFTNNVISGTFGVSMLSITEPRMRKTNNPYFGRVRKASLLTNVALGYNYENNVKIRLERKGLDENAKAFTSEKPKGKSWERPNWILFADADPNKKYLRCTMRPTTKAVVRYIVDGKIATDKQVEEIKEFLYASTSKKQEAHGLEEEEQVIVRDYLFDNIMYLAQGSTTYAKSVEAEVLYNAIKVLK